MNTFTRTLGAGFAALLLAACGGTSDTQQAALLDIAQAAARQTDRVGVQELARWFVEDRQDFALIDVRSADDFGKGAIRQARNIPIAELLTAESLQTLPRDRKLVLYSNGAENSAKAGVMLRLQGFDALVLAGGYNAWHERVLNPDIPAEELDGESLAVSEQRALACYFVGDRGAGAARRPEIEFEPPVFTEEEAAELPPLPPAGAESC